MEKMENKFVAMMALFLVAAFIPWIWLIQTYGLYNIPHYDLTMWIFMELYLVIVGVVFLGILLLAVDGEEDKPKQKMKTVKVNGKPKQKEKTPAAQKKKAHVKSSEKAARKPEKPKKAVKPESDGSYVEEPLPGSDEKVENGDVEYPAEWDERRFE